MRTIPPALLAHIKGSVLTLAMCWRLTRRDGFVTGLTSLDVDLVVDGLTYRSSTGIAPTSMVAQTNGAVANGNLEGLLSSPDVTEEDLESGRWDGALIETFLVNWQDPSMGVIPHQFGWLGQVKLSKGSTFNAEMRSLGQALQLPIGDVDSRTCPAKKCTCLLELAGLPENVVTGTVEAVAYGNRIISDASRTEAEHYFRYGKLTFTSGECDGLSEEVYAYEPGSIALVKAMPRPVAVGDTYTLTRGVDGEFETCKSFGNQLRSRGKPYILGPAALLSVVDK